MKQFQDFTPFLENNLYNNSANKIAPTSKEIFQQSPYQAFILNETKPMLNRNIFML